jgi:hypothetical protein
MKYCVFTALMFVLGTGFGAGLVGAVAPRKAPTAAVGEPRAELALALAEMATDEHRGRQKAEATLDETRREAGQLIGQLIGEVERLQKRPATKPMSHETADLPAPMLLPEISKPSRQP